MRLTQTVDLSNEKTHTHAVEQHGGELVPCVVTHRPNPIPIFQPIAEITQRENPNPNPSPDENNWERNERGSARPTERENAGEDELTVREREREREREKQESMGVVPCWEGTVREWERKKD